MNMPADDIPDSFQFLFIKGYDLYSERWVIDTKIDSVFYDNKAVATTINYQYNNSNWLVNSQKTYGSNNETVEKIIKYPSDFGTIEPYKTMVSKNMLYPVIEQSDYKNSLFLGKTVNEYKNWGNNVFAPQYIQSQTKNAALETRITYYNYDSHGNPLYMNKDDAEKVVYLWGYNYQYPVAKIENATYSDVCKKVGNGNEATGKTALETIAAKAEPATADWTTINNLRNTLEAMVTTYKYSPLTGMTEATSPAGLKTYYQYDTFNRLQNIKDENSKTIENYEYHYKN